MNFIKGLPKSRGKDTILVVADKLSKYGFSSVIPLYNFTTATIAQMYFEHIFILHGLPKTIVSDRQNFPEQILARALFLDESFTAYVYCLPPTK